MFAMVAIFRNRWKVSFLFFSSLENWCGLVYFVISLQEYLGKKATNQFIFPFS